MELRLAIETGIVSVPFVCLPTTEGVQRVTSSTKEKGHPGCYSPWTFKVRRSVRFGLRRRCRVGTPASLPPPAVLVGKDRFGGKEIQNREMWEVKRFRSFLHRHYWCNGEREPERHRAYDMQQRTKDVDRRSPKSPLLVSGAHNSRGTLGLEVISPVCSLSKRRVGRIRHTCQ